MKAAYEDDIGEAVDGVRSVKAAAYIFTLVGDTAAEVTNRAERISALLFKPSAEYFTDNAFTEKLRNLRSASLGSFARFRVLVLSRVASNQQSQNVGIRQGDDLPQPTNLNRPLVLGNWATWQQQGYEATPLDAAIEIPKKGGRGIVGHGLAFACWHAKS